MKELISHLLKQVAAILEYVIAFMLAIGIILLCLRMVCSLQYIPNLNTYPNYDESDHRCRIDPYDVFALSEYRI